MLFAIFIFVFCLGSAIFIMTNNLAPGNRKTNKFKKIHKHKIKNHD
jgi:hypothetical protein